jgi:hypothetical protein
MFPVHSRERGHDEAMMVESLVVLDCRAASMEGISLPQHFLRPRILLQVSKVVQAFSA